MATVLVDLRPAVVDLELVEGDGVWLRFTFWADAAKTTLLDISGYVSWKAQIRQGRDAAATVDFTVDETLKASSVIAVELTGDQVRTVVSGSRWDLQAVDPNGVPVTLFQGTVNVTWDASR